MKLLGSVLSAKEETRELTSKTDGRIKQHKVYHILMLAKTEGDNEVFNCEAWDLENFTLPVVGKEWSTPPIRSINFDGQVGSVKF